MRLRQAMRFSCGLILAAATAAQAQHDCQLDGQAYPENATVCSNGLVLHCSNGTWQNNDGAHCESRSGSYLTPLRPYKERSDEEIPEYYKEKYPNLGLK